MKHLKDIKDWKEMIGQTVCSDCLLGMKLIPDNSVDAIVTDPPYGLSFMGKKWDYDVPSVEIWKECLRILKPGGYLLAFAGTRTQHRMACNIEDGGFEIRDMIAWVYGSGFPKSLNIGKKVDQLQGNEREAVDKIFPDGSKPRKTAGIMHGQFENKIPFTKGTSEWEGWGTALKPSLEPITVARKPLGEKTIAENCLKWGTGGINIDESRVATQESLGRPYGGDNEIYGEYKMERGTRTGDELTGRFPANLIHDNSQEVRECFPESNSTRIGNNNSDVKYTKGLNFGNNSKKPDGEIIDHRDSGNASRFFKSIIYQAKASKSERNKGCEGLEEKPVAWSNQAKAELARGNTGFEDDGRKHNKVDMLKNSHPCVKPIALMEYLIKLVSRKDALILDPFTGSGSTLVACKRLDRNFIGFEMDEEYCKIADARVEHWKDQILKYEEEICEGQLNLF